MTEETALHILQLDRTPPLEDLFDIVDEQLFELRDYFLRNPVVRELYESRMARITRIAEAAAVFRLHFETQSETSLQPFTPSTSELTELLREFEQSLAQARLVLASSLHPQILCRTCEHMIDVQEAFEAAFMQLTTPIPPFDGAVRAAEHVDTGRLLQLLISGYRPDAEQLISKERRRILNRLARQVGR